MNHIFLSEGSYSKPEAPLNEVSPSLPSGAEKITRVPREVLELPATTLSVL